MGGEGFAFLECPEAGGTGLGVGGGGGFGGFEQGGESDRRGCFRSGEGHQGGEARLETVEEVEHVVAGGPIEGGDDGAETGDAGRRGRAAQAGAFEGAGGGAAARGGEAEGGERVFEDGEQGDRRQTVGGGAGEEAEEGGGRRVGERFAGAVVDDDAVAGEFGGDAQRELAVGGDEGGASATVVRAPGGGRARSRRPLPAGRRVRAGGGRVVTAANGSRQKWSAAAGSMARAMVGARRSPSEGDGGGVGCLAFERAWGWAGRWG